MRAPTSIRTDRLTLTRPARGDAPAVFATYASDPEVTRWVGFPRHRSLGDAEAFVRFSDDAWESNGAGPYLAFASEGGALVGSTGLDVETDYRASVGYVVAAPAWGRGYATEMARAMVALAGELGLGRLHAFCHVDHARSARVLEKSGFTREGVLRRYMRFPNLGDDGEVADVACYAWLR